MVKKPVHNAIKRHHGRGAATNPTNRFDLIEIEEDPEFLEINDRPPAGKQLTFF